jgi:cysteine synthase A
LDSAQIDDAYKVSDLEALHMAHYLIENEGLFVGGSCAVNLAAVVKCGRENPGKTIVTVLHDSGNRYLKKIYSEDYLREKDVLFHKKAFYDSYNL